MQLSFNTKRVSEGSDQHIVPKVDRFSRFNKRTNDLEKLGNSKWVRKISRNSYRIRT